MPKIRRRGVGSVVWLASGTCILMLLLARAPVPSAFSVGVFVNSAAHVNMFGQPRPRHVHIRRASSWGKAEASTRRSSQSDSWHGATRFVSSGPHATAMGLWQPIRYAVSFTGGIALSTWVNARVNRRNERIRQQRLDSGLGKGGGPSPELFIQRLRSIHENAAVKSAVELGVFTQLGALHRRGSGGTQGGSGRKWVGVGVPEIAQACDCSERGMRMLLDALASMRFLRKILTGPGGAPTYLLTLSSAKYLDEASETCMARLSDWYFSDSHMDPLLKSLTESIQGGTSAIAGNIESNTNDLRWVQLAESFGPVEKFAAGAVARVALEGHRDAEGLSVLDVAVGHGMYGIECARRDRRVTVTALGAPEVVQKVAVPNARKAGVLPEGTAAPKIGAHAESQASPDEPRKTAWAAGGIWGLESAGTAARYRVMDGSPFDGEDWGQSVYDVVIIPQFLHVLDGEQIRLLLDRARRALKPGGRCLVVEIVANEDRTDSNSAFSLWMLANTAGGDAYTLPELERACVDSGFVATRHVELRHPSRSRPDVGWPSTLIVAYRDQPKGGFEQVEEAVEELPVAVRLQEAEVLEEIAAQAEEERKADDSETWAYPISLGDFFSIFEGIVRSYLPGGGPEL